MSSSSGDCTDALHNGLVIFFPMGRFTFVSNALSGTFYTLRAKNENQSLSTIINFLEFDSPKYPNHILVSSQNKNSQKIELFFLSRILAMLILLEYDPKSYNYILKCANAKKDPMDILDSLTNFQTSKIEGKIDKLIDLLSIFIEFSDYDSDCVSKFVSSFTYNFLRTINSNGNPLPSYFVHLKKKIDDNDNKIYDTSGVGIIDLSKSKKSGRSKESANSAPRLKDVSNSFGLKYYFIKQYYGDDENDDDDDDENDREIPYACIKDDNNEIAFCLLPEEDENSKMICSDSINQPKLAALEYEINIPLEENNNFIDSLLGIPAFSKLIENPNDEEKPEYNHFFYFAKKMDLIYEQIQKNISKRFPLGEKDNPMNELYSIVHNITIFNYYISKTTKLEYEKMQKDISDQSFISNFLQWENYLILLIENIDQTSQYYIAKDIIHYIISINFIFNFMSKNFVDTESKAKRKNDDDDDDDDDEDNDENKKKEEENKRKSYISIIDQMSKYSLYLILLISKKLTNNEDNELHLCMFLSYVKSNKSKDYNWIERFIGYVPKQFGAASKSATNSFQVQRGIFKPSLKVGCLMKNFYTKSIDLIKRKNEEFSDVLKCVKENGLRYVKK